MLLMIGAIALAAGITAYRMAWTEQHRKLAAAGILLCSFGMLRTLVPVLARGLGL